VSTITLTGLDALMILKDRHREVGQKIHSACSGNYLPMDIFSVVALGRSLHHFDGFLHLLEKDNGQCAVIVLRAQLDTLLRYWAHSLFDDPHKFATDVLNGTQIRKMTDPCSPKNKLTDRYLNGEFGKLHDWIPELYDGCCSFAHFSNQHFWLLINQCGNLDPETGERDITITSKDQLSDEDRGKLIDAFGSVTKLLLELVKAWSRKKRNPEGIAIVEGAQ